MPVARSGIDVFAELFIRNIINAVASGSKSDFRDAVAIDICANRLEQVVTFRLKLGGLFIDRCRIASAFRNTNAAYSTAKAGRIWSGPESPCLLPYPSSSKNGFRKKLLL
jgi:hypothetical protein